MSSSIFLNPQFVSSVLTTITHRFVLILECESRNPDPRNDPPRFSVGGPRASQDPRFTPIKQLLDVSTHARDIQVPAGWEKVHQYVYIMQSNTDDHGWQYRSKYSEGQLGPNDEPWVADNTENKHVRRRLWMTTVVKRSTLMQAKALLAKALQTSNGNHVLEGRLEVFSSSLRSWQPRYVKLFHNHIEIWTEDKSSRVSSALLTTYNIRMALHNNIDGKPYMFFYRDMVNASSIIMHADSRELRRRWVVAVSYQIALNSPDVNFPPFDYGPPILTEELYHRTLMCGDLAKQGHVMKNWKVRFFQLTSRELRYFEKDVIKGKILLDDVIVKTDEKSLEFSIRNPAGMFLLMRADNMDNKMAWIRSIQWQVLWIRGFKLAQALTIEEIGQLRIGTTEVRRVKTGDSLLTPGYDAMNSQSGPTSPMASSSLLISSPTPLSPTPVSPSPASPIVDDKDDDSQMMMFENALNEEDLHALDSPFAGADTTPVVTPIKHYDSSVSNDSNDDMENTGHVKMVDEEEAKALEQSLGTMEEGDEDEVSLDQTNADKQTIQEEFNEEDDDEDEAYVSKSIVHINDTEPDSDDEIIDEETPQMSVVENVIAEVTKEEDKEEDEEERVVVAAKEEQEVAEVVEEIRENEDTQSQVEQQLEEVVADEVTEEVAVEVAEIATEEAAEAITEDSVEEVIVEDKEILLCQKENEEESVVSNTTTAEDVPLDEVIETTSSISVDQSLESNTVEQVVEEEEEEEVVVVEEEESVEGVSVEQPQSSTSHEDVYEKKVPFATASTKNASPEKNEESSSFSNSNTNDVVENAASSSVPSKNVSAANTRRSSVSVRTAPTQPIASCSGVTEFFSPSMLRPVTKEEKKEKDVDAVKPVLTPVEEAMEKPIEVEITPEVEARMNKRLVRAAQNRRGSFVLSQIAKREALVEEHEQKKTLRK